MSRPKHIEAESTVYFITTVVERRIPIFVNPDAAMIVIDALYFLRSKRRLELYGFVIMPDHVHLIIRVKEPLPKLMHSLKSFTAKKINRLTDTAGKVWQDGYYDYGIRGERDFFTRLKYMEGNPVRKRLVSIVDNYTFSSANQSFIKDSF